MKAMLKLLRERRNFRYLWLAQVVSLTGDWFNTIATAILVLRYTDSGAALSALFLARALPPFIFGPLAGVVADRFDRKRILIVSNLLRVFIVLGFLLVRDADLVWLVYVLTIAQFGVSAFFEPSYNAILPRLVERDELLQANVIGSITWSAMLTLGAAIGGLSAAIFGAETSLVIDSATFLVAALLLTQMEVDGKAPAKEIPTSGWTDFVEGLRFLWVFPAIGIFALVKGLGQFGTTDVIYSLYAEKVFPYGQEGAITFGVLFSVTGLGAVMGPIIGTKIVGHREVGLKRAIWFSFVLVPLSFLLMAWGPSLIWVALAGLLRGAAGSMNWTFSNVILQMKVPEHILGRVFGLDFTFHTLILSLAVWFSGTSVDAFGLSPRGLALWSGIASAIPLLFWSLAMFIQSRSHVSTPHPASASVES